MTKALSTVSEDPNEEIAALIVQMSELEKRLEKLTGGEVDMVLFPQGTSFMLRRTQEELLRSEAAQHRLADTHLTILNALPSNIALIDSEGKILSVNEGWRRFAGANGLQQEAAGVGQNYLEVCEQAQNDHAQEAQKVAAGVRSVLNGTVKNFELEYPCHSPSEQRWFRLLVAPLDATRAAGAVVMHINITARKHAEGLMRESEERFRTMVTSAATGIAILTPHGRFLQANAAYCRMLGYTEDELRTRDFASLTHPEDLTINFNLRDEMLSGKRESFVMEKRYLKKNGESVWSRASVAAVRANGGEIVKFIVVAEDITEQKQGQFRLQRLNRLHTVLSKVGEVIVRTHNRQELYNDVCRIVMEDGKLRMAFIAEVDAVARLARPVASFGEGLEYLREPTSVIPMDGGPLSQGTVGTALRTGLPDFCNNIAGALRMKPWHETALKHGLLANASFPFHLRGAMIGVWVLYAGETGYFLDDEMRLMASVANEISIALEALEKEQDRQLAEAALEEMSSRMQTVMANSKDYIYFKDRESRFVSVSEPFLKHCNKTLREELIGKTDFDLYSEAQARAAFQDEQSIIATGQPLLNQEENRSLPGGEEIWVSTSKLPWRNSAGTIIGTWGISRDITERKSMERILQKRDALLRMVGRSARLGGWTVDLPGNHIIWSDELCFIIGVPPGTMPGLEEAINHYTPAWRETIRKAFDTCAGNGEPFDLEAELTTTQKKSIWVHVIGEAVRNASGAVIRVQGALQDITAQKRMEEQFRHSQKMEAVGQLAGGVAHDFNNILGVIQMQSDLMKSEGDLSRTQLDFASEIGNAAQRAAKLTRQLLLFSRKQAMQMQEFELNQAINGMTKLLQRVLGEHVQTHFKFSLESLFVNADAGMLDQVIMNLAVNARDAMPIGGRLVIETYAVDFDETVREQSSQSRPGRFVCVSVSDTGSGIPSEILPKIFEPFFTTKGVGKGTGLGLATVFGIVQQHQGWINVYSEVGKGTTFKIYLPRLTQTPLTTAARPKPATTDLSAKPGGSETILLVEDDAALRAVVRKTLLKLGYRVFEAVNGVEAQEVWKQHRADIRLLLTDMIMPHGVSGKDLAKILLADNPKLKVVFASGYSAEVASGDLSMKEGFNYLTKPFQSFKLAKILRDTLDGNLKK